MVALNEFKAICKLIHMEVIKNKLKIKFKKQRGQNLKTQLSKKPTE